MEYQNRVSRRRVVSAVATGVVITLAGCSGGSDDGPEAALEGFFTAVDSGDVSEANSYYIDAAGPDDRPVEQRNIVINSIENHPTEEAAETASSMMDGGDVSVDEIESFGEQLGNESGYGDREWTLVYFDVEIDNTPEENYAWLVETEDGWKIGLLAVFGP